MIEESKYFIEWTAKEAETNTAAELALLQIQLARWQHAWDKVWGDAEQRALMKKKAERWSERILELSGII